MTQNDYYQNKIDKNVDWKIDDDHQDDETGSGEGGQGQAGGQSGQIAFHDFLSDTKALRDDLLSPEERKRLLSVHKDTHELRVKKQKELRDYRHMLKNEGKASLQTYRQGMGGIGGGINSEFKANPVLADKAQFAGIDRQVNALPTENAAENTNEADRNELKNQLRHTLTHTPTPSFNPKPQYHG